MNADVIARECGRPVAQVSQNQASPADDRCPPPPEKKQGAVALSWAAALLTCGHHVLTSARSSRLTSSFSAGILVWRLSVVLRDGRAFSEEIEHRASRIAGGLLFLLGIYVVRSAGWGLWARHEAEFSIWGLILTVAAIPNAYFLSQRKLAVAKLLGSRALRADAFEGIARGWLSFAVVVGLIAQLAIGAWWIDSVAALAIVYFLIKEGREAWEGDDCRE